MVKRSMWLVEVVDGPGAADDAVHAGLSVQRLTPNATPNGLDVIVVEGERKKLESLVLEYWAFEADAVLVVNEASDETGVNLAEELACPGCGCQDGDGLTPGCTHPDGCGYWTSLAPAEQLEIRQGRTTRYDGPEDNIVRSVN